MYDESADVEPGSDAFATPQKKRERSEPHSAVVDVLKQARKENQANVVVALPKTSEEEAITRWTADLNDILARANQPMLNFLGALSVKLRLPDVRYTMAWDAGEPDPRGRVTRLVRPAATVRDWITLNRDVGETLLSAYLESVAGNEQQPQEPDVKPKLEPIKAREHDACFDLRDLDMDEHGTAGVHDANARRRAPQPARPPAPAAPAAAEVARARAQLDAAMRALHDYREQVRRRTEGRRRARQRNEDGEEEVIDSADIAYREHLQHNVDEARQHLSELEVRAVSIETGDGDLVAAERRVRDADAAWKAARDAYEGAPEHNEELAYAITAASETLSAERATLQRLRESVTRDEARSHVAQAQELLRASSTEVAFAPAWAWECMGSAVWRRFVSVDALAAIQMAHTQVNRIRGCADFTVKELVCSHEVHDQFAFLVAYNYLSTSDTQPGRRDAPAKQTSGHMTYLNIEHLRRMLASKVLTCHVWFETHVRRRPNSLLAAFDKKRERMMQEHPHLRHDARWRAAMDRYKAMMPRYELICVEPW